MASPQLENGYLKIANEISEAIMQRDFSKRQRKILDLIFRLSYGCNKKTATIPQKKAFSYVGISKTHIGDELKWLESARIISINETEYSFNKNFEEWQLSLSKPFDPEELAKLVSFNLGMSYQNGNFEVPKTGTQTDDSSQNRNSTVPKTGTQSSQNRNFLGGVGGEFKDSKDIIKNNISINNVNAEEKKDELPKTGTLKKKAYGQFENVFLTDIEYKKLEQQFNSHSKEKIENLSEYKQSSGKKYKDDYATILHWARKDNGGNGNGNNKGHFGSTRGKLPDRETGYTPAPYDPGLEALVAKAAGNQS